MPETKVESDCYPSGQLRWRATIRNGKPFGLVQHWYENGVLKQECSYDDEGLKHGTVKDWNMEGKLRSACQMDHGTGVYKSWHENDQLKSESYYVRGKCCGRSRMWWEDGNLMSESYYIGGRETSKKKVFRSLQKGSDITKL